MSLQLVMSDIIKRASTEPEFVPVDGLQVGSFQIATESAQVSLTGVRALLWKVRGWLLGVAALTVIALLVWPQPDLTFPQLEPGSYSGVLEGAISSPDGKAINLYMERLPGSDEVFVVVFAPGWGAVSASLAEGYSGVETLTPLTVATRGGKLKFVGSRSSSGTYSGQVTLLGSKGSGSWKLEPFLDRRNHLLNAEDIIETTARLNISAELRDVSARVAALEMLVPQQRAEIERLTGYIAEGVTLKERATQRLASAKQDLEKARAEFKVQESEARRLAEQLQISERVTPLGKLVSLSRESLERENRWLESMFRSNVALVSPEFESIMQRNERVRELKSKIIEARTELEELEGAQQ